MTIICNARFQARDLKNPRYIGQRGIALMLVLWIITLLTIIAVGLTTTQRTETHLLANQVASARFRAYAEAAIQFAALNLMTTPTGTDLDSMTGNDGVQEQKLWIPDGQPHVWQLGEELIEIRIINEASLVDLNAADPGLLLALLTALGVQEPDPETLVDAILDWRDQDDLHLLHGAEDADYVAAGLPYGAKDSPFDSVEELQQVIGFDRKLYELLAPALTVYAGQAGPESEFAPELVKAALAGISLEAWRKQEQEQQEILGEKALSTNRGGPLYRIKVGWRTTSGSYRAMEALIRVEKGGRPPVETLWRRYAPASIQSGGDTAEPG